MTVVSERIRYSPGREFPPYSYLPGRFPHPVRDPKGHSYGLPPPQILTHHILESGEFVWGLDLFNHAYFWEAHEAWEGLWHVSEGADRLFLKGLILLCASGVKVREKKATAALRHASRAASVFRRLLPVDAVRLAEFIGMHPMDAATMALAVIEDTSVASGEHPDAPIFPFVLHARMIQGH